MTEVFVPVRIEAMTLGEAWISIAAAILAGGVVGSWDGLPIVEVYADGEANAEVFASHGDVDAACAVLRFGDGVLGGDAVG